MRLESFDSIVSSGGEWVELLHVGCMFHAGWTRPLCIVSYHRGGKANRCKRCGAPSLQEDDLTMYETRSFQMKLRVKDRPITLIKRKEQLHDIKVEETDVWKAVMNCLMDKLL